MSAPLLIEALKDPGSTDRLSGAGWTQLYRQARATGLLGRLAHVLLHHGHNPQSQSEPCPHAMRGHLEAAMRLCEAQTREVNREIRFIEHALAPLDAPVVVLKGAAYALAGLPAARGRVFSDIDVLVPRSHLNKAESLLMMNGWMSAEPSAYNQRYYREWMHELPPMQHVHRATVLDVHHSILPKTARLRPDPALLIADAVPLPGNPRLHVLSPADMVLHSMTHLFVNDDMTHALRDLSDLDLLVRHFSASPRWWEHLLPRAAQLDLVRPMFYALRQLQRVWDTPVPDSLVSELKTGRAGAKDPSRGIPTTLTTVAMMKIWNSVFTVPSVNGESQSRQLALAALYLRGHWMRMPMPLLVKHLSIKALRLHEDRRSTSVVAQTPTG